MGQGTKRKNTISILMVGFQSPGIILWSRHSIGGLSCLGGGLCSMSALVYSSYARLQCGAVTFSV